MSGSMCSARPQLGRREPGDTRRAEDLFGFDVTARVSTHNVSLQVGRRRERYTVYPQCGRPETRGTTTVHEEAIRKADVLIEALGFIRKFHGKFTVIKLGGSVMEDPETLRALLVDVVFMQTVGHAAGGRARRGQGDHRGDGEGRARRRISCRAGATPTRPRWRSSRGCWPRRSTPTSSGTSTSSAAGPPGCITRRTSVSTAGSCGWKTGPRAAIDLGRVGEVTEVDVPPIENLCLAGVVPVLPSLAEDEDARRPAPERQCRHGRGRRRAGASGREAGLSHRHARHPR